jgi:hypothetical protein
MTNLSRLLAVALAALALAACSLPRLAYNNASPVVTYMVDDYFDLSGDQEEWLRERFDRLHAWHRASELPAYERDLREAIARTERPVTADDARWVSTTLRSYYRRLVEQALPDMAELVLQLDDAQSRRFEERFRQESAKIERDTARGAREAREARRAARMVEQIEGYTGRLTEAQRELVTGRVHFMVDVAALRLEDRKLRQDRLQDLLRSKPAKPEMVAGLRRLLVDTAPWRNPDYTAAMRQRDEQVFEMLATLAATLAPEQREGVRRKLRGYLADVSALMAAR